MAHTWNKYDRQYHSLAKVGGHTAKEHKNVRNVDDFLFAMVSQILAISKKNKKYVFNFGVRTI